VAMAGLVLLTAVGIYTAGRARPRPPEPQPADLAAALADVDPFSPQEALARLAAQDRHADRPPPGA